MRVINKNGVNDVYKTFIVPTYVAKTSQSILFFRIQNIR